MKLANGKGYLRRELGLPVLRDHVFCAEDGMEKEQEITSLHFHTAQHFASPRMTLNERFTVYQRQAAERESAKARKSPEIHR